MDSVHPVAKPEPAKSEPVAKPEPVTFNIPAPLQHGAIKQIIKWGDERNEIIVPVNQKSIALEAKPGTEVQVIPVDENGVRGKEQTVKV